METVGGLLTAIVRWVVSFSLWTARVRSTHRGVAFQHRFRFRLCPRWVFAVLPEVLGKRVAHYVPFVKKKHSWCRTARLGPGIHWYWPKTTEVEILPVERQTIDLPVQSLQTADLRDVSVRAEVIFVISDIYLAVRKTFDFQQTIQDVAQFAVVSVVVSKTCNELGAAIRCGGLHDELTQQLQVELRPYGVTVNRAFLCEWTKSRALRLYSEPPPGPSFASPEGQQ
jgi:hypothetical protein